MNFQLPPRPPALPTSSSVAEQALITAVGSAVPGWTYKARVGSTDYADAPHGWARVPGDPLGPAAGQPMRTDTIIHVASMSKPICVTAFVALREDWQELADGVAGRGPLAATATVALHLRVPRLGVPGVSAPLDVRVPRWLLPGFSSELLARKLLAAGAEAHVSTSVRDALEGVASGMAVAASHVPVPPGYPALLSAVLSGAGVPHDSDPFLPLMEARLREKAAVLGVPFTPGGPGSTANVIGQITLKQLVRHNTKLRGGITDPSLTPGATQTQPCGGQVTCDLWACMVALLNQPADAGTGYKNSDYAVLGAVVEQCSGMDYDDYVAVRLLSDARFASLRRYVTEPDKSALYYSGAGPWTSGNAFPDYRGWTADGGFYYTADQITDWLHTLYSVGLVARTALDGGSAPIVSTAGRDLLFGTSAYFSAGASNTHSSNALVPTGWTTYTHNGGTGFGCGSCNGDMGLAVSSGGEVVTAFFCANGKTDGTAAFNHALNSTLEFLTRRWP